METLKFRSSYSFQGTIIILSAILCYTTAVIPYPPRYQPELDQLTLDKYIMDDYLFNMHINCLFYDGPCDPVGRWMKPRMASYYLSACVLCTPNQEKEAYKFMDWLHENHPQLFRIGVDKYLTSNGISLPENSRYNVAIQKMNVPKVATNGNHEEGQSSDEIFGSKEEKQPVANLKEGPKRKYSGSSSREMEPSNKDKDIPSSSVPTGLQEMVSTSRKIAKFTQGEVEDDEAESDFKYYQ